ncbi:class I SAM-dependent DNA methyltransferase [Sphingomonas koreensis]|uniref:class I SAM-dependent DNA methyltransferase n=1 Tax=Sphingomonas koreensis TaxID=93064 RepID=UPI000830CA12|nr:DNA methyltransferase [Sphingomonas koreensis]PJI90209.1 type II restriction/modification system DNA methylase subunit YeeA [Sphingomonas koreensis]RSU61303.1 class I SAM-dependent DNA methyltransferase [Sphingomonas koreensis]RSU69947.1 class I SAM-dependent DNA methyltransferase [Sphingomonas koreensis]
MNAVEIEEAVTALAAAPFDRDEFPFAFLQAFGNKETTLRKLRSGTSNKSDIGGVLQTSNIHIAIADAGDVTTKLDALRASPATTRAKAKFILATDGEAFEAEDLLSGETVACPFAEFPDHFGFFLPLAGITTVKQVRESSFDIRATGRLNKLYVELLKDNPDWGTAERRPDMNHFLARLIFCFFAEDTDIFHRSHPFTGTVEKMSDRDSSNTHEVIGEIFRAMNTAITDRTSSALPRWADGFPYVNGGLFSGSVDVPRFSKIARTYLLHIGNLDWKKINPDIFGSMIQAVADDEERGALGMHYTSVPNILKVLNPLFLDDLREHLAEADDNPRKLLNLRSRMARIRVFDPACGSGNFLVIAYKEMRAIEAIINERRGEKERKSDIPLTNFRGIELRDFPAEIARLALIIAEYQCDVLYRGQQLALNEFLPLDAENWITCGNALGLDWMGVCPPTGTGVKLVGDDLFQTPLNQSEIDFQNEGGETYICGNPPYVGTKYQDAFQKSEIAKVFQDEKINFGNVDYIGCWFLIAAKAIQKYQDGAFAFVSTSSLFQGEQAEIVLHILKKYGITISWAQASFPWSNNAANNAGVICCIVGCDKASKAGERYLYENGSKREVKNIGPYLVPMPDIVVSKTSSPISLLTPMNYGSMSNDDGHFTINEDDYQSLRDSKNNPQSLIKITYGGAEFIKGIVRRSLYIANDSDLPKDQRAIFEPIFERVRAYRSNSARAATKKLSDAPMLFAERRHVEKPKIFVPQVLSERREYITAGLLPESALVIAPHMQIIDGGIHEFALLSSKMHHVWVSTVCGRLKNDIRYSSLLGWNTFPVPLLTEKNISDLQRSGANILTARESHFPMTISELYDPSKMPDNLRESHDHNDEILERIYVGRRFRNNTERLEHLLELYANRGKVRHVNG